MNKKTAFLVAALYVAAGVSTVNYFHTRRIERAKRAQIELNLQRDIAAIRYAHDMVQKEIMDPNRPVPYSWQIEESFRFYKLTAPSVMK